MSDKTRITLEHTLAVADLARGLNYLETGSLDAFARDLAEELCNRDEEAADRFAKVFSETVAAYPRF